MFEVTVLLCSMLTQQCSPVSAPPNAPVYENQAACLASLDAGQHSFMVSVAGADILQGGVVLFAGCIKVKEQAE